MEEIIEKYEAKLAYVTKAIESKKHLMNSDDLEALTELKFLLIQVVTDFRAVKIFCDIKDVKITK